jgi:hypothetical protein
LARRAGNSPLREVRAANDACIFHVSPRVIDIDEAFRRLAASPFRRTFRLVGRERAYAETWGLAAVMKHGEKLIAERLAPAFPRNDGKQTPWRNHPIFVAQHATANLLIVFI